MIKKVNLFMLLCAVMGMTSCEKVQLEPGDELMGATPDSYLSVRTRTGDGDATVSFPLSVYVFSGQRCHSLQIINSASETLRLSLPAGTFDVCAIGGATATTHELPSQEQATPASIVTLRDGQQQTDLMTAQNTVTLHSGQQTELSLSMQRQVAQLRSITIQNVPDDVTAVCVTMAPLYQHLTLDGQPGGRGSLSDIALSPTATDASTWTTASPLYTLPSIGHATISIAITNAGGTTNYSYTCTEDVEANYIFDITGTYNPDGILLGGTLTGDTWQGERTISFSFAGSSDTSSTDTGSQNGGNSGDNPATGGDTTAPDHIPAVGEFYQGCCVLAVRNATATTANLVLLSPTQKSGVANHDDDLDNTTDVSKAKIDAELATWSVPGITTWRMMTVDEMNEDFIPNSTVINAALEANGQTAMTDAYYLVWFSLTEEVRAIRWAQHDVSANFSERSILRPVADASITIE